MIGKIWTPVFGSLSNTIENELIDHVFNAGYTAPGTVYISLSTADILDDASGNAEPGAGAYARVAVNTTGWTTAASRAINNNATITFPKATASWGTITHYGIWNHATNATGLGDTVSDYVDFDPWLTDSVQGVGVEELEAEKPLIFSLQVHPNPFTNQTQIRFTIHDSRYTIENTELCIYDASGRLVKSFNHESCIMDHGSAISWDGTDQLNRRLASGVYFVNLSTDKQSETRKVLLVR